MRRMLVGAVAMLLVAMACADGDGTGTRSTEDGDRRPIRVGVVGPMTGLASFVGKNMVEGIQLAVDDLNEDGGVLEREVEFVIRDDEADPARTSTAVRELVESEQVVALFGPSGAANYLAIERLISDAKVPTWAITSDPSLSERVNPYAFRAFLPDTAQVAALAEYAGDRYSRVALLTGNEADGIAFRDVARAALRREGLEPVAEETFALDDTDFSPIVLKIRQANADAIILSSHLGLIGARLASALDNLDYDAQILGVAGLINYTYPDLARDAADDTIFVSFQSWGHLPRGEWPASVASFYDRYVEEYLPEGEFSETGAYRAYSTNFLTYDMVRVWARAVEEAGTADPEQVAAVLNEDFTYPGDQSVIGVPWTYTATDHDGIKPDDLYFYRWDLQTNGMFELQNLGSVATVLSGGVGS